MTGIRLEIELQSVIVPTSVIQNIINCVESAGLNVNGLVIKSLASALGSLTDEETRTGAVSLCVGGGTTGVALFSDGRPVRLTVIPIGGDHITNDLAYVLKIPISKAENIKHQISLILDENDDTVEVEARGRTKLLEVSEAVDVVSCRLEELFVDHVLKTFSDQNVHMFPAGIVLSGGVAKTGGIETFTTEVMNLPVRIADPLDSFQMPPGRNDCEYTTSSGIIRYIMNKERNPYRYIEAPIEVLRSGGMSAYMAAKRGGQQRNTKSASGGEGFRHFLEMVKKSIKELF
jgi:cell division protein FtsA